MLPAPPPTKSGFPWTEAESSPQPHYPTTAPRISVITPSYNQGQFLEETIRSVLLQGYPNLEYIVIDGESSDNSVAIIEKYAEHLAYWVSEPDRGQTNAINKGFARATGEIMGWLNSDDLLLPGALHAIAQAFMQNPHYQVVTGFRKVIDPRSRLIINWTRGLPTRHHLLYRNCIAQESTYWRREVWERLGELDESHNFGMDYDYWQRMLQHGYRFHLLPQYLGAFRLHETSKTTTLTDLQSAELARIMQKYNVALTEEAAVAQLGRVWKWRYGLIKDLCHTRWFDSAQRAWYSLHFLHSPLALPLLAAYGIYRG